MPIIISSSFRNVNRKLEYKFKTQEKEPHGHKNKTRHEDDFEELGKVDGLDVTMAKYKISLGHNLPVVPNVIENQE